MQKMGEGRFVFCGAGYSTELANEERNVVATVHDKVQRFVASEVKYGR